MLVKKTARVVAMLSLAVIGVTQSASQSAAPPTVGSSAIGGIVTSAAGGEAGVWVIAETTTDGNRLLKIVVTDDQGRFVLPDLPQAKYKVWARGYGLLDSAAVDASLGQTLTLKATPAPSAAQAAQIYPANYWSSLIQVPLATEFPGTGPKGNGISPQFKMQEHWVGHMIENCQFCHQLGTLRTRTLADTGNPHDAWGQRTSVGRSSDDIFFEGDKTYQGRHYGERMSNLMTLFGRDRGLNMFADWTTRIAKGEVPAAPPRPVGVERNVVITMRDIGGGRFLHDSNSSDKRNPTVNAGGPIYGYATFSGMVVAVDPVTGKQEEFKLTDQKGNYFKNANNHTGMMDGKGRLWMSNIGQFLPIITRESQGANPAYCTDASNKYARYFPRAANEARLASVFDPKTRKTEVLPVCFGTHHLNLDKDDRLYLSGDTESVGWVDVKAWDTTKDPAKSIGWCPFVLDTNGDGKITPDSTQWNLQLEGVAGGEGADFRTKDDEGGGMQTRYTDGPVNISSGKLDPKKDTRIAGFNYGMGISPKDQSYWAAKYSPYVPSGILRVETGASPPQTCKSEYFEAPKVKGNFQAFNARGVDVDADGVAWVAFGTGAIGKFDRSKCKVLNGPSATGQHCPEGWEIIDTPGPKFKGLNSGSDWFYLVFVDHHNSLGLGKGVPIFPNSSGDELLAYLPKDKKFVHMRVPYPLGFYSRGVDGRIDNEKAGWKGRGLWATNNNIALWHQETGEGSTLFAAHFQVRPNPLAE